MKLSDIKGDRVFDVIAELIDPICNIAEDDAAMALFRRERLPDGMTAKQFLLKRTKKAAPALLKGHKSDMIAILSAIDGTAKDVYTEKLNLVQLVNDFIEMMTDDAFKDLFTSAQSENSSGSAQENTEAREA